MKNKGLGKVFSTRIKHFRIRKTVINTYATFTLSQFDIGWVKIWHNLIIQLIFISIHITWIKHKTKENAIEHYKIKKQDEQIMDSILKGEKNENN